MKTKLFLIATMLFALKVDSQTNPLSYNIITTNMVSTSDHIVAINASNLESFRFKTTINTLVFDDGVKVELKSAQELFILGLISNPDVYTDTRDIRYTDPIFHLVSGQNPTLITLYKRIEK